MNALEVFARTKCFRVEPNLFHIRFLQFDVTGDSDGRAVGRDSC